MYSRIIGDIIIPNIELKSFIKTKPICVKSIRTSEMDPVLKELVSSLHKSVRNEVLKDAKAHSKETLLRKSSNFMQSQQSGYRKNSVMRKESTKTQLVVGSAAYRRMKRLDRKSKIEKHLVLKPNENEDDERDIQAILLAEKTLGDYKLKFSDDYEVPDEQRVNADKKRRQMVALEESMMMMKLKYNERFVSLRILKKQLIEAICSDNERIRKINRELGITDENKDIVWEAALNSLEFLDDFEEVIDSELLEYRMNRLSKDWKTSDVPLNTTCVGTKTIIKFDQDTGLYYVQKGSISKSTFLK